MDCSICKNDEDFVILWKFIAAMAMAKKPKNFMEFCENFMELSTEEDEDKFQWNWYITEPLLDDMEEQFK